MRASRPNTRYRHTSNTEGPCFFFTAATANPSFQNRPSSPSLVMILLAPQIITTPITDFSRPMAVV